MSASALVLPGPLFFFLAAMAVAFLAYLLHRWAPLSGLVSAAGCLILCAIGVLYLSERSLSLGGRAVVLGRSFLLLSREWALMPSSAVVLTFLFGVAGVAFLLALPGPQGWSFYPFGVGAVGVLALAATAQEHVYAVLLFWLAANVAVFVLAGGRPGATMGALRFLALTALAAMPLLILPSYLGGHAAGPGVAQDAPRVALVLAIVGFGILFMVPPFHGQLVAVCAYAAPMAPALVLSAFPPVAFHILFALGQAHPALLQDAFALDVWRWMGTAAVAIGGLAALGQRRWGFLVGYAALVDWGAGLIALGQGTQEGMAQAAQMLVWRALSLLLAGAGLTVLFQATGKQDELGQCRGLLYRRPLNALALFGGLFSLAGFPLTPGAAGRWPLILDLLASDPGVAWTLILAGVGVSAGALNGLRACVARPAEDRKGGGLEPRLQGVKESVEAMVGLAFGLLALWLIGVLFLHPAPWLEALGQALAAFTFFEAR